MSIIYNILKNLNKDDVGNFNLDFFNLNKNNISYWNFMLENVKLDSKLIINNLENLDIVKLIKIEELSN